MIHGDIQEAFNNGYFDHPSSPYYYKIQSANRIARKKSKRIARRGSNEQ